MEVLVVVRYVFEHLCCQCFAGGSGFMPLANHRAVTLNPDGSFQATMSPFDTHVILFNTSKPSDGLEGDEGTNAVFNPGMERFVGRQF